jgi:hypothetical protein
MAAETPSRSNTDGATIELSESELESYSNGVLIERLVKRGVSRLTAERVVEIHRGKAEASRARSHATSRR